MGAAGEQRACAAIAAAAKTEAVPPDTRLDDDGAAMTDTGGEKVPPHAPTSDCSCATRTCGD